MGFRYVAEAWDNEPGGPPLKAKGSSAPKPRHLPDLPPISSSPPLPPPKRVAGKREVETLVLDDDDDEEEERTTPPGTTGGVIGPEDWEVDEGEEEEMESVEINSAGGAVNTVGASAEDQEELAKVRCVARGGWRKELTLLFSLQLESELSSIDKQIDDLRRLRSTLQSDRTALLNQISSRRPAAPQAALAGSSKLPAKGKVVDYTKSNFPWSQEVLAKAREVWGISEFRLCQEAAINASLDGREVVAVLPTGGGKSLIYQLPAVLAHRGTTIVVTPCVPPHLLRSKARVR